MPLVVNVDPKMFAASNSIGLPGRPTGANAGHPCGHTDRPLCLSKVRCIGFPSTGAIEVAPPPALDQHVFIDDDLVKLQSRNQ